VRILVTGADAITGHAVIRHLVARGADVRGLVSLKNSKGVIKDLGATPIVGDLRNEAALRQAMAGVERVYHICPAWEPDEIEIGEVVVAAAQASDISLLGYHSVLAPHLEEVPSHWAKMRVQMALMHSGVPFSIFQPAAYMQCVAGQAADSGKLALPIRADAPLSWVDVEDVGEAVANLMTRPGQRGGTYELCGTKAPLTPRDIAEELGHVRGQPVEAAACRFGEFVRQPPYDKFGDAQLERLKAYYRFVDTYGMRAGNPKVLTMILGRPPTSFAEFARRLAAR
jgi:uncharacterized protein YbjT (DUF2867 family)